VLAFKNLKKDPDADWVGEGAAETLTTKLAGVSGLRVVERGQIKRVLAEQDFQRSDMTDPASAVKAGRVLGAERIVIGTFACEGGGLIFNVRVVDVRSALVLNAATLTGRSTRIFETLLQLSDAVIRSFDKKVVVVDARARTVAAPAAERIVLTPEQKKRFAKYGTTNWQAYKAFAQAATASDSDAKLRWLTQAIKLDPDYAYAYNDRANVYFRKGQLDRAARDYDRALKLDPGDPIAHNNRGVAYARKDQHRSAIRHFNKAIQLRPGYAQAYTNRGLVYAKVRMHERAIQDFNKAIHLDPSSAMAYRSRATSYAALGQHSRAIRDYDTAILLSPRVAEAHFRKAEACERAKRYTEAVAGYRRFLELETNRKARPVRRAQERIRALTRR